MIKAFSNKQMIGILGLKSLQINKIFLRFTSVIDHAFLVIDHECVIDQAANSQLLGFVDYVFFFSALMV